MYINEKVFLSWIESEITKLSHIIVFLLIGMFAFPVGFQFLLYLSAHKFSYVVGGFVIVVFASLIVFCFMAVYILGTIENKIIKKEFE